MLNILHELILSFWNLGKEMAPYLLLGFFFAGLLKMFFKSKSVYKAMGKNSLKSVFYAALLGVPLPLCSCGVIPTGISLRKKGASNGATISFLISTPQTGVDSILITWSLLGLPFAILRPIIAFISGIFGGSLSNYFAHEKDNQLTEDQIEEDDFSHLNLIQKFREALKYGYFTFMQDIVKWLFIGLVLAAIIDVSIPANFFTEIIGNRWLEMLMVLVVSVPLYVCATGSVPIAAVLLMKGLSPGAALIFLMAGPATNAATITVIWKSLGKKTAIIYLTSIILSAVFFGIIINQFLPQNWFIISDIGHQSHIHGVSIFNSISFIILMGLMTVAYFSKFFTKKITLNTNIMNTVEVKVDGMTCNHCKANVEKGLKSIPGITDAIVDLNSKKVILTGEGIDLKEVETKVNDLGYTYLNQ